MRKGGGDTTATPFRILLVHRRVNAHSTLYVR